MPSVSKAEKQIELAKNHNNGVTFCLFLSLEQFLHKMYVKMLRCGGELKL